MAEHDAFPFTQFLKEFPRGAFDSYLQQAPFSSFQTELLRPKFRDFSDQFRGQLATGAQQGQLPTLSFVDYLGGLDPYEEFYKRFNSPQSRNPFSTRSAFTRFNF